ncbi:unnamed protein product, partial [Prunus brigantina]
MWVSVGEGKNREVAYVSRPRPADGSGVPTFKMPNTKAGQWYKSRDEPISELEAHLSGAFEANNSKAKFSGPTKALDDGPSKVEKSRKVQLKVKPPVLKNQVATKVVSTSEVNEKKEDDHEMAENVRGKTQTREDKPKVEEDQVMVDVKTPEAEEKADVEAIEASENSEGILADDEELYGEDEEYGEDEYFEELTEEAMEQLAKERTEEMAKFENELKVGKAKVKFGDFDEVEAMVVTLPLFFEAQPGQPNSMDGDVFDEIESMVQMGEPKEIEVIREIPRAEVAQPQIVMPSLEKRMPEKVKVLVDTGATVNILPASVMKKLKKSSDELIPTETTVSGFVGDTTRSKGIIPLQVRVGGKIRMTAFFVVETTAPFSALLGRDWIHGSMCVPSSLHQTLQFWHEDGSVELVQADSRPLMASANVVEARFYEDDLGPLYFTGSDKNGRPTGVS